MTRPAPPAIHLVLLLAALTITACSGADHPGHTPMHEQTPYARNTAPDSASAAPADTGTPTDTATFGSGCFWCTEAVFQQLDGVVSVTSGYSGGRRPNPTYEQVCSGATGHAEVCQIAYDSAKISYTDLLQAFFMSHDPTTLNRQGADQGTQYRSVIFYHNEQQHRLAAAYKAQLDASHTFKDPIVTEISPFTAFYPAEDYHQDYYSRNGRQPYCQYVIRPKLDKFTKEFKDKLRK